MTLTNGKVGKGKEKTPAAGGSTIQRPRRRGFLLLVASALLVIVGLLAVGWGSFSIPVLDIISMIENRLTGSTAVAAWPKAWETVIFDIRLPRIILAALVGAALSQAGVVFQGLFRNPLADPYLIGISSGAGLGATIAIAFGIGMQVAGLGAVSIFAFAGALFSTIFVYLLSRIGGRTSIATLLLAGVALGAFLSSMTTFLMFRAEDAFRTVHIVGWLMGSFAMAGWPKVRLLAPVLVIASGVILIYAHRLNVLQLDEEQAQQLGVPVEQTRLILVVLASLITAVAVSVSGVIGFVGLIVPHAVRLVWGPDHKFLLPMSALCGGIFMIIADTLARTLLSPSELPVGVITAFCGAPFFLYLLRRRRFLAY
ncbi:MAG: iron ABC transporter permease [Anaerolineales bacterium]|nr:iron ABC transporter permease [Anaerolineales bacterium]